VSHRSTPFYVQGVQDTAQTPFKHARALPRPRAWPPCLPPHTRVSASAPSDSPRTGTASVPLLTQKCCRQTVCSDQRESVVRLSSRKVPRPRPPAGSSSRKPPPNVCPASAARFTDKMTQDRNMPLLRSVAFLADNNWAVPLDTPLISSVSSASETSRRSSRSRNKMKNVPHVRRKWFCVRPPLAKRCSPTTSCVHRVSELHSPLHGIALRLHVATRHASCCSIAMLFSRNSKKLHLSSRNRNLDRRKCGASRPVLSHRSW
jgi:hypothetical protein